MMDSLILEGILQHPLSKEDKLFLVAKAAMQAIIGQGYARPREAAEAAVMYANALIQELEHEKGK